MKFIIVGLGNFGSSLGEKLTQLGHEVIGVDQQMDKVEAFKEKLTHTIRLDCTERTAVSNLPLRDTDVVIICIGENEGDNIMATALMKQFEVKRLISRAVSPLHKTVLEAMGLTEIVHPEEETAERWAHKLNITGIIDSFALTDKFKIVEASVPKSFVGKKLMEIGTTTNYQVLILSTIKMVDERNVLGVKRPVKKVQGVAGPGTILSEGDILVLFGNINDIKRMLKDNYE